MAAPSYHEKLQSLRAILKQHEADGFVLSVNDEFFSEYPPEHFKRLQWLTGFTGSAGTAVVLADKAAFFTDGRYTLQAAQEVSAENYAIFNSGEKKPLDWVLEQGDAPMIGFDPWLWTPLQKEQWSKVALKALAANPIDALWREGRAEIATAAAFDYPVEYAGQSREAKIAQIAGEVRRQGADTLLMALPESICWLLNIRGHDMEFTPLLLCRALLDAQAQTVELFVPPQKITAELTKAWQGKVTVSPPEAIAQRCRERVATGCTVLTDPAQTPVALAEILGAAAVKGKDPCSLPKACKNAVELEHIAATHIADGRALTKFLEWVNQKSGKTPSPARLTPSAEGEASLPSPPVGERVTELASSQKRRSGVGEGVLTEISAAEKLEQFRREESNGFIEPSFPTIAGFGPNGAVVHYRASEASNREITGNGLFLVDSGGQYLGGTTDVTRTIAIGNPSQEMKENYTRVLKGHIALANAVFPKGTTGAQLDVLARQYLWQAGLDYDHGTGHGVGCFLGVHEGPQGISKRYVDVPLQPGMILSNEPGYYKAGEYGIRIENLVVVSQGAGSREKGAVGFSVFDTAHCTLYSTPFYYFRTLTCAPLDEKLVVWEMLTSQEKGWWDGYHAWVKGENGMIAF